MIEADADIVLRNTVNMVDLGHLSAKHGDTLKVLGPITLGVDAPGAESATILFGSTNSLYGSTDGTGTVILEGSSFGLAVADEYLEVSGGKVRAGGAGHNEAANAMFSQAYHVQIDYGATLDVGRFGDSVTLNQLVGTGTLESAGGMPLIHLSNADFQGVMSDNVNLEADGTNTISADIHLANIALGAGTDDLDLSGARGNYALYANADSTATVKVGALTQNHIWNFADGTLTIDTTYASTDSFHFSTGEDYIKLSISQAQEKTLTIDFYGIASSSDLAVGTDDDGHLQVTYDGAAPAVAHTAAQDAQANLDSAISHGIVSAAPPHDFL